MPSFQIMEFRFFFWANEFVDETTVEPVHIHVCKGLPASNAPKWWVGPKGIRFAGSDTDLSRWGLKKSDFKVVEEIIRRNTGRIISMWADQFGRDNVSFFDELG